MCLPPGISAQQEKKAQTITIDNTTPRRDEAGQILDAHDGTLQYFNGRFYLYGTHYGNTNGAGKTNYYVSYSSSELTHWKYEGKLIQDLPPNIYFRPHVIYNRATGLYVLWYNAKLHYGVATSQRPQGPFQIVNPDVHLKFSAFGLGDFGLVVDSDGTGYIAYVASNSRARSKVPTSDPQNHRISVERLASDFLSSTLVNSDFIAGNVESPALFKRDGIYYLLFDNTCGFCWNGTGARVYTTRKLIGAYTYQSNINMLPEDAKTEGESWTLTGSGRSNVTLRAQQTDIAELPTPSGTMYMWIGDRWHSNPDGLKGHDFQVWVPLEFQDHKILPLKNLQQWQVTIAAH